MAKKTKKRTVKVTALPEAVQTMVSAIALCGFDAFGAFAKCCDNVLAIVKSTRPGSPRNRALEAAALGYRAGYVACNLLRDDDYAKRWGNMSQLQQIEEATRIIGMRAAKAETRPDGTTIYLPDSKQPDGYRNAREHKAVRASDVSWLKVREATGLKAKKAKQSRAPRTGSTEATPPPVDLVKASPTLATREAANDYFGTAAAALLATVDKNVKAGRGNPIDPRISTAVHNFLTEVKAALGIK